mgnify:FL=1
MSTNEIILNIIGNFNNLEQPEQNQVIRTLQQTVDRNKKPGDNDLEAKEEELILQHTQQILSDLEEIEDILK